jgi:hypothetical protein
MQFPKKWQHLLDEEYYQKIKETNVRVFDKTTVDDLVAISLIVRIPKEVQYEIYTTLQKIVPESIKPKIIFQPKEGYHLTIQWAPNTEQLKFDEDFDFYIVDILSKYLPLKGDLYYPFFGPAGLGGILKTKEDNEFKGLRIEATELWKKLGMTVGYKDNFALAFASFTRYLDTFTDEEKELLKNIPAQKVAVELSKASLVLNNKFVTPGISVELVTYG